MLRSLLIVLMVVMATACASSARKHYIEPEDEVARQCIDECGSERTRCLARAQDIYRQCNAEYEYQERVFRACHQRDLKFCLKPERCPLPERQHCTDYYDSCFRSCGGYIETEEPG